MSSARNIHSYVISYVSLHRAHVEAGIPVVHDFLYGCADNCYLPFAQLVNAFSFFLP